MKAGVRLAAGLLAAAVLASCGGGGAGGDGGNAGGGQPPSGTGLVPAAPAPGATLVDDAAGLRPLRATATWTYRGVKANTGAQGAPTVYTNVVTQTAQADGSFKESATDSGHDGPDEQTVVVRAGEVRAVSNVDTGTGTGRPLPLDVLELRSPVRVGDQYTLLDTRIADIGVDVDGDRQPDGADVAVWSRVTGTEVLDLVNRPQTSTVRVTSTIVTRLVLSKTGTVAATVSGTTDVWYAPGIGVVQRRSDIPSAVLSASGAPTRDVTTETLVSWDGITEGIGLAARKPATDAAGVDLQRVLGAVSFDAHALVMTMADRSSTTGIVLTTLDGRGSPGTGSRPNLTINARLVRVGSEARVITYANEFPFPRGLEMHAFDAAGRPTGAPPVLVKPDAIAVTGGGSTFLASGGADAFWITWVEPASNTAAAALQTQAFDASGTPLAAPLTLATLPNGSSSVWNFRADATAGHLVVSWDESMLGGFASRYALVEALGPASVHTLRPATIDPFGVQSVATGTGSLSLWGPSSVGPDRVGGVTFDAAGEPRRSNGFAIDGERLSQPWLSQAQGLLALGGPSATLLVSSFETLFPEDPSRDTVTTVVDVAPEAQPLATSAGIRLLARVTGNTPQAAVRLDRNVLYFSETLRGVDVTSVWLHD